LGPAPAHPGVGHHGRRSVPRRRRRGGGELVGTHLWRPDQEIPSTSYVVVSTIEELLEMLAVVILAYGLTTHLRDFIGPVTLRFRDPSRAT